VKVQKLQLIATCVISATLAACGGGGNADGSGNRGGITTIKVAGDSLSDSGALSQITGARIFSVNQSSDEPNVLWTERIAANLGTNSLCSYYSATSTNPINPNSKTNCTSFAVGGSRINNAYLTTGSGSFVNQSILYQLKDATAKGFKSSDLLLLDGGANDVADLIGAYLAYGKSVTDNAPDASQFLGILNSLPNPPAALTQLAAGPLSTTSLAQAGGLYMKLLADYFYTNVKSSALNAGATKVLILNIPKVTKTPRLQAVLQSLPAASQAPSEALFDSWVKAYNSELAAAAQSDSRVVLVDFYQAFSDQFDNPAQFGISNVTTPACPPVTPLPVAGLPSYNLSTCTPTTLATDSRAQGNPDWWKKFAFSDNFHPSPYGHQLMSQLVSRSLAQAGWL